MSAVKNWLSDASPARLDRQPEVKLIEFTVFAINELIMKLSVSLRWLALFPVSAVIIVAGCGYDNGLKLSRVSGKVTYKGEPVKNGTVFFMPDEGKGTVGPSATGSLRDDGTYIASTDYAGDGVIIGTHKVGLTALERVADAKAASPGTEKESSELPASKKAAAVRPARKQETGLFTDSGGRKYRYLLPKKLSNPNNSGISAKVESGSSTLNFDIDEDGQVKISH